MTQIRNRDAPVPLSVRFLGETVRRVEKLTSQSPSRVESIKPTSLVTIFVCEHGRRKMWVGIIEWSTQLIVAGMNSNSKRMYSKVSIYSVSRVTP